MQKITEYIWVVHVLGSKDNHYCLIGPHTHKKINKRIWEKLGCAVWGWQQWETMDALPHEYFVRK